MRTYLPILLLTLLVITHPALASNTARKNSSQPLPHLQRRFQSETAKRMLDTEVPDRLRNWRIFQDGNRFREGVRNGYINVLRQVDKVKEPYSFSHGIKKEWIYQPDLRKQYFLPRVLRLPAILQKGPIPHEQPFTAFLKSTDEEFGLHDVAVTHVPDLSKEKETEAGKASSVDAKAASEDVLSDQNAPRASASRLPRRRRPRTYHHRAVFNQFQSAPHRPTTPAASDPEIHSDRPLSDDQAGAPQSARPFGSKLQSTGAQPDSPSTPPRSAQPPSANRLSNTLVEMEEKFKTMQKFQESQIQKASMRYKGHPQYRPPVQPEATAAASATAGIPGGLTPIRTKSVDSLAATPDMTPRKSTDLAGTEADISNPLTPTYSFPEAFTPPASRFKPDSRESPEMISTPLGDPSPLVSTPGGLTPKSKTSTGATSPDSFRLPANYDQLLHDARMQRELNVAHSFVARPSIPMRQSVEPIVNPGVNVGWNDGRPTPEGVRKLQEMARINDIDHAVYDHAFPRGSGKFAATVFDKVHPVDGDEQVAGLMTPGSKRKAQLDEAGDTSAAQIDHRDSFPSADPRMEQRASAVETGQHLADVEMKDASSPDNAPSGQPVLSQGAAEATSSPEAPAKKRKKPPALTKPIVRVQSFFFPTSQTDPVSPYLEGFKPSFKSNAEPNTQQSPAIGFDPATGAPSTRLRSLQDKLKSMSPFTSQTTVFESLRDHRSPQLSRSDSSDNRSGGSARF